MENGSRGDVLITGASRGIGLATAQILKNANQKVIGIARRPPEAEFPGIFYEGDFTDAERTAELLQTIVGSHKITGLVNNVGLNILEPLEDVDLASFKQIIDLNLRTAIQCAQAVLPHMKAEKYGRIVNISSRSAIGRENRTSYSAAKAGLIGMTYTWALELAQYGITVNAVSPGPTATDMFKKNNIEGKGPDALRPFLSGMPMGRLGEPEEIAYAISFFLSPEASFITGQVLHACGGSSLAHHSS